jgi:hypothetical protein
LPCPHATHTWCSLRGNRLTIASFQHEGKALGLPLLTNLVSLDLSNNPLELGVPLNRSAVFGVLKVLPKLVALGLAGTWDDVGKPLTRDQRLMCIRLLPSLKEPLAVLRCGGWRAVAFFWSAAVAFFWSAAVSVFDALFCDPFVVVVMFMEFLFVLSPAVVRSWLWW